MNIMAKFYTVFLFCGILSILDAQENNIKSDRPGNGTKIEEMPTSVVDAPPVEATYVSPELQEKHNPGKLEGVIENNEKSEGNNSEAPLDSSPANPSDELTKNRAELSSETSTQKYASDLSTQDTTTEEKLDSESQQNLTNIMTPTGTGQDDTKDDSQSQSQQWTNWHVGKPFFTTYFDYYQHYYEYPSQYSDSPSKTSGSDEYIINRVGDSTSFLKNPGPSGGERNDVSSKSPENGGSNKNKETNAPTLLTLPNQIVLQTEDGDYIIIITQQPTWGSDNQYPGIQGQYPGVTQRPTFPSDTNEDDSIVINAPGYARYIYQYIVPPRNKLSRNIGRDEPRVISSYGF